MGLEGLLLLGGSALLVGVWRWVTHTNHQERINRLMLGEDDPESEALLVQVENALVSERSLWEAQAAEIGAKADIHWQKQTTELPVNGVFDGAFSPSDSSVLILDLSMTIQISHPEIPPFLSLQSGDGLGRDPKPTPSGAPAPVWTPELAAANHRSWCRRFLHQLRAPGALALVQVAVGEGRVRIAGGVVHAYDNVDVTDVELTITRRRFEQALEVATALRTLGPKAANWIRSTVDEQVPPVERQRRLRLLLAHYPSHRATAKAKEEALQRGPVDAFPFHLEEGSEDVASFLCSEEAVSLPPSLWLEGLRAVAQVVTKARYVQCLQHALSLGHTDLLRHALGRLDSCAATPDIDRLAKSLEKVEDSEALLLLVTALGKSGQPAADTPLCAFFEAQSLRTAALKEAKPWHFNADTGAPKGPRLVAAQHVLEETAWALGRVGSAHSVPRMREAAESLDFENVRDATEAAIQEIQGRLGDVATGGLALVQEDQRGQLSLAQGEGGLSFSDEGDEPSEEPAP